jgi:tRNA(Ile)-lysidine synthase
VREQFEATIAAALDRIGVPRRAFILIALSGGADSVALLHALIAIRERLGLRLTAAHFNHHLRGAESDRDEMFVRDFCSRTGIALVVGNAQALGAANLEERARDARYEYLGAAADRLGASHIALGHHADDQAETVLMRLLRGAGASGLKAMAERGPKKLIRPMLSLGRAQIIDYLNAIGASFVTDSTNMSTTIARNRVRSELIPALERDYSPGLRRRLVELAAEMRSIDDLLTTMADAELDRAMASGGALDLSRFAMLHDALRGAVLRGFIARRTGSLRRISRSHVEAIRHLCVDGPPSGGVDLPGGWRAEREYATLRLHREHPFVSSGFSFPIAAEGRTASPDSGFIFEGSVVAAAKAQMPASPFEALFDASQIGDGLAARGFVRGDRIRPLGMEGTRKVKDVFIDHKVPRARRAGFPLVVSDGEVVWIPGVLRGRGAIVTKNTTQVVRLAARLERVDMLGCVRLKTHDSVLKR